MITFEPIEWAFIETANQLGFDKKPFHERIKVGSDVFEEVKKFGVEKTFHKYNPDEPELFARAVIGLGDIAKDEPTNMLVGLDVTSSGPQNGEVGSRDTTGLAITGAIDLIVNGITIVPDVYTEIENKLRPVGVPKLSRKMVKEAVIPYVYGSTDAPKSLFGKFYKQFKEAFFQTIPGSDSFKNLLIDAWRDDCMLYKWELPDGFVATTVPEKNIEFRLQLLGNHSYTYVSKEPSPLEKGDLHTKALSANVFHAFDGFMLREVHRICNYDPLIVKRAKRNLKRRHREGSNGRAEHLEQLYWKFKFFSFEILEVIQLNIGNISEEYINICLQQIDYLLSKKPFKLISIHDEFMCSPLNCNILKQVYNNLLGALYCSDWFRVVINELRQDTLANKYVEPINWDIYNKIVNNTYALS